ncbi:MAG: hypothetical protein JNL90_21340 [Planctomycetes bacterium]|nr:hypothetical protein [Planctomycetota bacterium]
MLPTPLGMTVLPVLFAAGLLAMWRGDALEWSQRSGDASNRCAVDQEPIRGEPVEAWRQKFDAVLLGPVVSVGRAVAVVREGKERKVVVVDVVKGGIVGRKTLDKGSDPSAILVIDGLLAVVDPEKTKTYRLAGDSLRAEKTVADGGGSDAMATAGLLLVREERNWKVIDPVAGKSRGTLRLGRGRPCVEQSADDGWRYVAAADPDEAGNFRIARAPVTFGASPSVGNPAGFVCGYVPSVEHAIGDAVTVVTTIDFRDHVYVWFPRALGDSGVFSEGGGGRVAFQAPPIVHAGRFIGFSPENVLLELAPEEGKYRTLVDAKELPKGASVSSPSRARNVLYHGNWALEIESRRVLWCIPGVEPDGPLVPAGDGRAVVRTKGGELVGFAEKGKLGAAPAAPTGKAAGTAATAKRAPPVRAPSEDAELAQRLAGDERAMHAAFEAALTADLQESWLRLFDRYAEFKLWDECRRIVVAAQKAGLDEARAQALLVRTTGKASSGAGNAELQKKKLLGEEQEVLQFHRARIVAAADWCGAHQLPVAATVLARRAVDVLPGAKLDVARVAPWIPAEFPWPGNATSWAEWAEALLPSGAKFLGAADPAWKRVQGTLFSEGSVALRSGNLLLFTREVAPEVVGPALARGEAVVASLAALLPAAAPSERSTAANEPLEVRLHASRDDYVGEKIAGGETPEAWSAGVYVPSEKVSRFYSRGNAGRPDPLGRGLHETMAHELTHHWLDARWITGRRSPLDPGIWLVEGFAEFIGQQSVEVARRGTALDDATVMSLDVTAAAARAGHLLDLAKVLAINAITFRTSLDGEGQRYQLRHTLTQVQVDPRSLFYSQSAALAFFALHRCGETGRNGYIELLASCYRGEPLGDVAKRLGFAHSEALSAAFIEFVRQL